MSKPTSTNGVGHDHLKSFVERIERLLEEKKTISDDVRDVYAEAGSSGFDVKALRAVIRLRAQDAQQRQERELILETYKIGWAFCRTFLWAKQRLNARD